MKLPGMLTYVLPQNAQKYYKEVRTNGPILLAPPSPNLNLPPSNEEYEGEDAKPPLPPGMKWGENGSIVEMTQRKNSISSEENPSPVPSTLIPLGLQRTTSGASDPGNPSSNSLTMRSTQKSKKNFLPLPSRMTGGRRKTRKQRNQKRRHTRKNSKSRKSRRSRKH